MEEEQTSIAIETEEKEASGDESVALTEESPFRFDATPLRLYHFAHQFRSSGANNNNNFLKGVKWSPDGSCFLTCSDDNSLRLFYLPEDACTTEHTSTASSDSYGAGLIVNEGESVYDYCWYPYMSASDPTGCVFASTSRDHPIHLWDCITGQLRCTYRAYDAVDEITAALSVSFNSSATKLFAGYNKKMRVFDVHRPGREYAEYSLSKDEDGASAGLVSSICFAPAQAQSSMFALGSYNQTTTVYEENSMEPLYILHGQQGGVTQVLFSKDGNYLYTGGRKDPYILCWDIRNTGTILYKLYRSSENTNQRISFDIEPSGRYLGTGGQDGLVHIYDLQTGQWVSGIQAAADTVNGLSFHPYLPLAASSSGHRRFGTTDDDDDSEGSFSLAGDENCCSVWRFSSTQEVLG
ncbi:transducin/WD40 repeat-like superfamily protein [Carex rostrata]